MIDLSAIEAVYVRPGYTDMRKGIAGLVGLAEAVAPDGDVARRLFCFCGKDGRNVKILEVDYRGWWLYQRRLAGERLRWPKTEEEAAAIDRWALQRLLSGLPAKPAEALRKPVGRTVESH